MDEPREEGLAIEDLAGNNLEQQGEEDGRQGDEGTGLPWLHLLYH